jgi:hypothetical protein
MIDGTSVAIAENGARIITTGVAAISANRRRCLFLMWLITSGGIKITRNRVEMAAVDRFGELLPQVTAALGATN